MKLLLASCSGVLDFDKLSQSVRSTTSTPARIILDGTARGAVCDMNAGGVGITASDGVAAAEKLQVAALSARMVAGDVASPGVRVVGVDGVLGGTGECSSVANKVALLDEGIT